MTTLGGIQQNFFSFTGHCGVITVFGEASGLLDHGINDYVTLASEMK